MAKRFKVHKPTADGIKPVSVIGTPRWRKEVPLHLQEPLAKALHFMEQNDIPQALWWFGESMNACQSFEEAKPILFFGGQVAGHRWLELKGAVPDHPDIPEWQRITEEILNGAVESFPDDPVSRHNRGRFYQDTHQHDRALADYRRTLLLKNDMVETWANMGTLLYEQGDRTAGMECWERACSLPAEMASGHLSQAYYWLRTGQYEHGWQAFNQRWNDLVFVRGYGRDAQLGGIHWAGEKLNRRRHSLFLHGEQGLGDHIQFARYIPVLRDRGIQLAGLETRAVLKRWMEASFQDIPIYARDVDERPSFTHHCSTMDLPGLLGTTVETVPPPVAPCTNPLKQDLYRPELRLHKGLYVGIAWEGAKGNTADALRSIPAEHLARLADIPGVTWVSLQFGQDASLVGRSWLGRNFVDGTEGCSDFLDTAAVMRGLDLIVTVDTATAHAAGTLGIPTWTLHRFCREWRWGDQGETTPWYPSMRLLTVPAPGDWAGLLTQVRVELEEKAR